MKSRRLHTGAPEVYVLVMDKGDDFPKKMLEFARQNSLTASTFQGIGAFSRLVLGYFEKSRKEYRRIVVDQQVEEVVSLTGWVTREDGDLMVHAHAVVGRFDGTAMGGHVLEATVWPTLEVVISRAPGYLRRRYDPETGLALIEPEES